MSTAEHQDRYRCLVFSGQERLWSQAGRQVNLRLVRPPRVAAALSSRERLLVDLVFKANGLSASHYRSEALARRLPALLRFLRAKTVDEGIRRLQGNPQERSSALDVLLIGATAFFRDLTSFSWLEREVVPQLGAGRDTFWVWSVGTSTGQELVSFALILARAGLLKRAYLRGSDCRSAAIEQARSGRFPKRFAQELSTADRVGYFIESRDSLQLAPDIAARLDWRCENVLAVEPFEASFDVILCRNLGIYLSPRARGELWRKLTSALRPSGVLVFGKAERPSPDLPFRKLAHSVYQRKI